MEQSLRRALDAGDASDPAFRETIYAASERALERMLAERPLDEGAAQAQRIRLAETINRVEQDYYQATEAGLDAGEAGWTPDSEPEDGEPDERAMPGELRAHAADLPPPPAATAADARTGSASGHRLVDENAPAFLRRSSEPAADRRAGPAALRPQRVPSTSGFGSGGKAPSGGFRRIFVLVVALAFALLAYLVYGMIYGPTTTEPAATSDASPGSDDDRWIALFDGTQLAAIATPTGGRVETVTGFDDRPAVRMSSAGEGGEIEVAVGPGVARELAGETVRVELTVGSPDGEPREFGVRCLFSGQTVCGTQRFRTAQSSEAFVFDMAVPRGARNAGSIAIEPGYGAGSRPLDLYGVRARMGEAA
ncbi:hypothetical protein ASG54_21980 [Aureimonas sp. Leaf460]|nr:hypothetical protein ASG62_15970 [Aureimonas sp. Leaf427]KQT70611.1 hypothetical protein ASG54_21980 [Aureimonas sp. Leaf460]